MIAHPEGGCDLNNPKNWRTRTSIHVEMGGHHVQIDAALHLPECVEGAEIEVPPIHERHQTPNEPAAGFQVPRPYFGDG